MDMQNRNHTSNAKSKTKNTPIAPIINLKAFTALQRHSKAAFSVGALTCAAFGGLFLASSFQSTPSKETAELVTFVSAQQAIANREKYNISETDLLKQQLQSTYRELEEYKAHLFRSSHPNDQAKIAELGHLLSEKERLNQQLTAALQALEKELHAARKHAATLELTTEALSAMLQTQKNSPNDHIAHLTKSFETEKNHLVARINSYEGSQSQLTSVIEDKHSSLNTLRNALSEQNQLTEALVNELHDLSNLYSTVLHIHQSTTDHQAQVLYEELQANDLYTSLLHTHLEAQQSKLAKTVQKERDLALRLQEELFAVQQTANSQFNELQELKNTHSDSVIFASLLTHQLDDLNQKHADIQNEKNALDDHLASTKSALEEKTEHTHSLDKQISELALHHQHHQQESMELETNLQKAFQEIASLKQELHETQAAKDELADELASVESLMGDLKEQSKMSMVQYSLALQAGDELDDQINAVQRKLNEKESALEDSKESIAMLQSFIQDLTDDTLALEKENNWLSTQHEDDQELLVQHNEQVQSLKDQAAKADEALADAFAHYDSATKELEEELKSFKVRLVNEEDKNDLLQDRLAALISENSTKITDSSSFKKELEEATNKITELEASLAAQDAMLASTGMEIRAHEETTSLLHIKHNAEVEELKAQQEEHLSEIAKMHEHLQTYTERHASAGQRNTELEAQIQSLISDLEETEHALNQSKHQENDLAAQSAELERRIQALSAAHRENEEKEHSFTQELLKLQKIIADKESDLTSTQQALANLKLEFTEVVENQFENNDKEATLIKELETSKAQFDLLSHHFNDMANYQQKSEQQENALRSELQKLTALISDKDRSILTNTKKLTDLQDEFRALAHQHEHAYSKLDAMEQELVNTREHSYHSQAHANAREGELTAIQISLHDHIEKLSHELQEKNQELAERTQH